MPRYPEAQTFDIVRSVKNIQTAVRQLQIQNPGLIRKSLNQITAALNINPYFWGGDSTGWTGFNGTFTVVSDPPSGAPYPYAAFFTIGTASTGAALEQSGDDFPVVPNVQYSVTAWIWTPTTSCSIGFDWRDSSHNYVSSGTQTITVAANTWTQVTTAQFAAPTAVFAYPRIAPADAVGNAIYVQAVTCQLQPITGTIQPGSSPPVIETWHDFPAGQNSWGLGTGGYKKYRLTSDGMLAVSISLRTIGTKNDGTIIFASGALPTGYQPISGNKYLPISFDWTGFAYSTNHSPYFSFNTDGAVQVQGINSGTAAARVECHGIIPLI